MTSYPGRRRGFTLLELLVVLAILGVLGVVAAPFAGGIGRGGATAEAAARELIVVLRSTRAEAAAANRPATVTVDREAHAIRAAETGARPIASGVEVLPTAGRASVTFYPDGGSSGARFLVEPGGIVVDVDWLTGAVRRLP